MTESSALVSLSAEPQNETRGAIELSNLDILAWNAAGEVLRWSNGGEQLSRQQGHEDAVTAVVETKTNLLSWGEDAAMRVWSKDGRPGKVVRRHEENIAGLRALSSGQVLTWGADLTACMWSSDGALTASLRGHTDFIDSASELPNGQIVTCGCDATVRVWSAKGALLTVLEGHEDAVHGVVALDDLRFASWGEDGTVRVWSRDGRQLARIDAHQGYVGHVVLLDGDRLISSGEDKKLRVWSYRGEEIAVFDGVMIGGVFPLSPGRIMTLDGKTLRMWSTDTWQSSVIELGDEGDLALHALTLDDGRIVTWGFGYPRLWSPDGALIGMQRQTPSVEEIKLLADGRLMSWTKFQQGVCIWSVDQFRT